MIEFLSGVLTTIYLVIALAFLKYWKRTRDRLFIHFAGAFALFALNQLATTMASAADERTGYFYFLRVIGYGLIIVAIIDKNIFPAKKR